MNCDDCREMILDLLYAELAPAKKRVLEDHLASCPDCAREYQELGLTLSAVRALPDPEVPPLLDARIAARAKEAAEKSERPRTVWSKLMRPAMAMAALAVITASVAIVMREKGALETGAAPKIMAESGKLKAEKESNAPGSAPLASLGYLEKDKDRYRELPEAKPTEAQPEAPAAPAEAAAPEASGPPVAEVTPEEAAAADKEAEALEGSVPESGATAPAKSPDLDGLALAGMQKRALEAAAPAKAAAGMPGGAGISPERGEASLSPPYPSVPSVSVATQSASSEDLQAEKPSSRAASSPSAAGAGPEEMKKAQAVKPSAPVRPDPQTLLREAQALEAQKNYREALARYEQALALMGYDKAAALRRDGSAPSASAADEVRPKTACSPQLTAAMDGAARLYKKLLKRGDLKALENWRQARCP